MKKSRIFVTIAWSCEKWQPIKNQKGHFDPPPASFRVNIKQAITLKMSCLAKTWKIYSRKKYLTGFIVVFGLQTISLMIHSWNGNHKILVAGAVCSIEESSGPQNLWVPIVLKASKYVGVKSYVPKINEFVHLLHPF